MSISLKYLPALSENFEVDRVDAFPVVEISLVKYNYCYAGGRRVIREKVIQIFGVDSRRKNLYGCHTIEEENDRRLFNFIGGDQNSLLRIPLEKIIEYRPLK